MIESFVYERPPDTDHLRLRAIDLSSHADHPRNHPAGACAKSGCGFIFKSSYDKANRTSLTAQRGIGRTEGLRMLAEVRQQIGCPVLTDVHLPADCAPVAEAVDVFQIPRFLAARPTCCSPPTPPARRSM